MEQTQWALEAGWRRAMKARLVDDQYTGELLNLADVFHNDLDASVQITIKPQEASIDIDELSVTVTLQTKDSVPIVTRRSRSWPLNKTTTVNKSLEIEALK
jgi:hypothetical protein